MIAIIDYNMGNIGSVANMIKHVGGTSLITNNVRDIANADKIILPGVGSFETGMQNLERLGLIEILNKKVLEEKVPVLGICLGMQLLSKSSEEGVSQGLGWINAKTVLFTFDNNEFLKIPHMGWNDVNINIKNVGLLKDMPDELRFYFDHSYYLLCDKKKTLWGHLSMVMNLPVQFIETIYMGCNSTQRRVINMV